MPPNDFGDITDDDVFDPSDLDPEAVARIFLELQIELSGDPTRVRLDELHPYERALLIFAFATLILRLRKEGALRG